MFTSYTEFAKTLESAIGGDRAAQGQLKNAILEADSSRDRGTFREAVTSDMLAPWFTQAVQPAFEDAYKDQEETWSL